MSVDDVHAVVHIEAAESQIMLPDGTRADVENYALPGGVLHVEYDGAIDHPDTRVALVWQPLRQTFDAVTSLLKRVGEPASGRDALVRGLEQAPAVWIEPKCDRVLTYYRRPEYWIGDEVATVLRVEGLSKLPGESPAIEAVRAWRASGAPPNALEPPKAVATATAQPEASGGEIPPRRTVYVRPVYPPLALKQGVKGLVTLRIFVQRNGRVAVARVADVQPAGYGFEQAAVEAAEQWRFIPVNDRGRPVDGVVEITVQFP